MDYHAQCVMVDRSAIDNIGADSTHMFSSYCTSTSPTNIFMYWDITFQIWHLHYIINCLLVNGGS